MDVPKLPVLINDAPYTEDETVTLEYQDLDDELSMVPSANPKNSDILNSLHEYNSSLTLSQQRDINHLTLKLLLIFLVSIILSAMM